MKRNKVCPRPKVEIDRDLDAAIDQVTAKRGGKKRENVRRLLILGLKVSRDLPEGMEAA